MQSLQETNPHLQTFWLFQVPYGDVMTKTLVFAVYDYDRFSKVAFKNYLAPRLLMRYSDIPKVLSILVVYFCVDPGPLKVKRLSQ